MTIEAFIDAPAEVYDDLSTLAEFMRFELELLEAKTSVSLAREPISLDRLPVSPLDVVVGEAWFKLNNERHVDVEQVLLWRGSRRVTLPQTDGFFKRVRLWPGDTLTVTLTLKG